MIIKLIKKKSMLQLGKREQKTLFPKYNKIKLKLKKIIAFLRGKDNIDKKNRASDKDKAEKAKVNKKEDKIIANLSQDYVKMSLLSS